MNEQKENEKINVPEDILEMCRELARTARKIGLHKLSGSFDPPLSNKWNAKVSFSWEAGRHNEDADEINITSQYFVHAKVNPKP